MRTLAYILLICGALSIPVGHGVYSVALSTTHAPTFVAHEGLWVVIVGYFAAIALLTLGVVALRMSKRPG